MPSPEDLSPQTDQEALLQALDAVLTPLAQLAVSKGVTYAQLDELLKQALVRSAAEMQVAQGFPEHRLVSRISAATGINRREVTRLTTQDPGAPRRAAPSVVSQLVTRWVSDKRFRVQGKPRSLPRSGDGLSFESLARSITQDVHPRTLLDELCRLALAQWDAGTDMVHLVQDGFVPRGDWQRLVGFLGDNIGDHLLAAKDNVLAAEARHFEQAVFADGLSAESVDLVRVLARKHWAQLMAKAVPLLERRIQQDAKTPALATKRIRIGLFTYHQDEAPSSGDEDLVKPKRPRRLPSGK